MWVFVPLTKYAIGLLGYLYLANVREVKFCALVMLVHVVIWFWGRWPIHSNFPINYVSKPVTDKILNFLMDH